jgi:hypothetical protein
VRNESAPRHAINLDGPGYEVFFSLFGNFEGYVDFFLLQDMVTPNGDLKFFLRRRGLGNILAAALVIAW